MAELKPLETQLKTPLEQAPARLAAALQAQVTQCALRLGATAADAAQAGEAAAQLSAAQGEGQTSRKLESARERDALLRSGVVAAWPSKQVLGPNYLMVLDAQHRLAMRRHFDDEQALAQQLAQRASQRMPPPSDQALGTLKRVAAASRANDAQQAAVGLSLERNLLVVTGGPGTGKTTTLAMMLATWWAQDPARRVGLAAPTGKAVQRMNASLLQAAQTLGDVEFLARLARPSSRLRSHTLHSWLGLHTLSGKPRHDARNPWPVDCLVLDEGSMLDLHLARLCLDALPPQASLVILGDQDQLTAVEPGHIFPALSAAQGALAASCVRLTQSHRFDSQSALGRLAAATRDGAVDEALSLLAPTAQRSVASPTPAGSDLQWHAPPTEDAAAAHAALRWLEAWSAPWWADYAQAIQAALSAQSAHEEQQAIQTALAQLDRFRVLTALRAGPLSLQSVNARQARVLNALLGATPRVEAQGEVWLAGHPVLITRNAAEQGLANGDTGFLLPPSLTASSAHDEAGALGWRFIKATGDASAWRAWPLSRLPAFEAAFAMTVHKSQGSEFDRVAVVLPAPWSPVATRELLYTGITRARKQVAIVGTEGCLRQTLQTRTLRESGLNDRILEALAALASPGAGAAR